MDIATALGGRSLSGAGREAAVPVFVSTEAARGQSP